MKEVHIRNTFRFSVLVIALAAIVSIAGCSSGDKEVASGKDRMLSIMQLFPAGAGGFSFTDIYALRTDENLSSVWESFKDYYYLGNDSALEKTNSMASTNELYMFEGDSTFDQLMEFMRITINGSYNYGGFTVRTGSYNSTVVIINGSTVIGYAEDVQSCIDVVNGDTSSLYMNTDIKAMVNRLPVGFESYVWVVDNDSASENMSGLLLEGVSMTLSGDSYIETAIYQFNSSGSAQQYAATASNVSEDGTMQIARTQDGVYVTEVITPMTATPTPTVSPTETSTPTPTP